MNSSFGTNITAKRRRNHYDYMLILIIALTVALVALFAQFGSNYYTQVKLMRRLFRNKGHTPDEYRERSSCIKDIDYLSVFAKGQLDIYTANDATEPQPILLWIHGGGYVGGDKSCVEPWAHIIAAKQKIAVISVNYCLAPEQHYPCPIIQVGEALRFLSDNRERFNLDTSRIFLAGDSAGAQIASQFAALVYNENMRNEMKITPPIESNRLKGVILCCGFYNMDTVIKSGFPAIKTFMWAYTDCKKLAKYARKDEMSTVKHVSEGYCDVFLTCGNADPFLNQAREMEKALLDAEIGGEIYLPQTKGRKLGHEYQFLVGTPEADTALTKAMEFIEKRL